MAQGWARGEASGNTAALTLVARCGPRELASLTASVGNGANEDVSVAVLEAPLTLHGAHRPLTNVPAAVWKDACAPAVPLIVFEFALVSLGSAVQRMRAPIWRTTLRTGCVRYEGGRGWPMGTINPMHGKPQPQTLCGSDRWGAFCCERIDFGERYL